MDSPSTLMNAYMLCLFRHIYSYSVDFDTDGQWITCCCDRWIYKDCIDSESIDNITCVFVIFDNDLFVYNFTKGVDSRGGR